MRISKCDLAKEGASRVALSPRDFIVVYVLVFSYAFVCQSVRGVMPKVKFY